MVMQLVDEGKVDLDRPIDELLDKPLPAYPDWASLRAMRNGGFSHRACYLTHSSGLANLRFLEPDQDLKFHFVPGQSYSYSGEGFYLLQLMLEEGLGLNVKSEMQTRLFDRFGMTRTDMQWREDFADNLADGYAMDGSFEPHDERSNVSASGSMDTTIADQAQLWRAMLAGEGLSKKGRAEWSRGQLGIRSPKSFQRSSTTTRSIPGVKLLVFPRASALKPGKARADAILPRAVTTTGPAILCYARKQSNAALSCWRTVFGPKIIFPGNCEYHPWRDPLPLVVDVPGAACRRTGIVARVANAVSSVSELLPRPLAVSLAAMLLFAFTCQATADYCPSLDHSDV